MLLLEIPDIVTVPLEADKLILEFFNEAGALVSFIVFTPETTSKVSSVIALAAVPLLAPVSIVDTAVLPTLPVKSPARMSA